LECQPRPPVLVRVRPSELVDDMDIRLITAGLSFVLTMSAQNPPDHGSWGWILLAAPVVGAPLSAEQKEERILLGADGTKRSEVRTTNIFRDSAGRIRAECNPGGEYEQSTASVTLVDPTARAVVTLVPAERRGFRIAAPASAKGFGFAFPSIEGELRAGSRHTKTDDLGIRVIEGIEFKGTRTEPADQTPGSVGTFTERWYSVPLDLTCSLLVVTANGRHSVVLQHIQRGEPDPALFVSPPTYEMEEIRWPHSRE